VITRRRYSTLSTCPDCGATYPNETAREMAAEIQDLRATLDTLEANALEAIARLTAERDALKEMTITCASAPSRGE
jgi:hypothetical protein